LPQNDFAGTALPPGPDYFWPVLMPSALQAARKVLATPPLGVLPARMRLLFITTPQRTGGWLAEAFASDSASDVVLEEAVGVTAGLARVRDEAFDAVLLSHDPGELDALEFVEGLRAGGSNEPMIVLGSQSEQELAALCYEVNADGYACVNTTTTRTLIWTVARAIERHRLIRDNQRYEQTQRARLQQEHQEAERLLDQQRQLILDLEALRSTGLNAPTETTDHPRQPAPAETDLPAPLVHHYRELLRTYVIMGSGNLGDELRMLSELLVRAQVSPQQAMQLHLTALEDLLEGLGSRSTRHVLTRADLLVLEVMVNLAEGYRQMYLWRMDPPRQRLLPGFDMADALAAAT
jgi:DNA-binding NarL/FixJ family response regulator